MVMVMVIESMIYQTFLFSKTFIKAGGCISWTAEETWGVKREFEIGFRLSLAVELRDQYHNADSMESQNAAYHPCLKPAVVVTGTANEGTAGPAIGHIDIGVSDAAYLFRVAVPGLRRKQSAVKCIIESDGKVHIEGVMTETGLVLNSSTVYQMKVQQLCTAGSFTISFNLPGSVDTRLFSPVFRPDGILEVVVMKSKMSQEFLKSSSVKYP